MEISRLLSRIENIARQSEELSALKGENFNVFQIFEMERDENKMHSRFINTLLNPKGSHCRGTIFLELFLNELSIPEYFDKIEDVHTKVEHHISKVKIDEENSIGGRIDIYIYDGKKSISIENKISATDQENQIVRYCNYQKKTNKVFYLTLFGTPPEDYSKGKYKSDKEEIKEPDFYCISYSETILNWLDKCQKEASDYPIIRETIKQYIITLKRLTGQLTNQKMNAEINKLIVENHKSARIIANHIENAEIDLVDVFLSELKITLEKKLTSDWIVNKDDINKPWSTLKVLNKDWFANWAITLQGQSHFHKNETILGLPYGENLEPLEKLESSINEGDLNQIKADYPWKSKFWYFYRTIFNFGNEDEFSKLIIKEQKKDLIELSSSSIIELAEMLEKHLRRNGIKDFINIR